MIPYWEICIYYSEVIAQIYKEIQKEQPTKYLDDFKAEYGDEYKEAYGWLQKAGWRLSETVSMKNHYDEPEFKYYGLENLSNVQSRIDGYLNKTSFPFSEEVYDYHKYDDIVAERKELIKDPDHDRYWDYYYKLHGREQEIDHFDMEKEWILHNMEELETVLEDNSFIVNKTELTNTIKRLKEEISNLKIETTELKP